MARGSVSLALVALATVGALVPPAAGTRVSPVQKILQLLGEMQAKTEADLKEEEQAFNEFTGYCQDGNTEKGYAIKTAEKELADLGATVADSEASVATLDAEIEELTVEISEKTKE